ncbi:hypothetical protein KDA_13370 [Dictyobacter alpinus]|uniref:Uncharacterized protein n=1 Tax=Dictyobacter alpinus TaxID=2014873 RepID=A0A402B3D6_9CHLR|nr:hypothetical protein KDA_13370 [Dictyobacter alpinus]
MNVTFHNGYKLYNYVTNNCVSSSNAFTLINKNYPSHMQWYSIKKLHDLPRLAFNHIKLLRMALSQFFTSYYHEALKLQKINTSQCKVKNSSGVHCPNTAYWQYNGLTVCPVHIQVITGKRKDQAANYQSEERSMA